MTEKIKVAMVVAIIALVLLPSCQTPIIPGVSEITLNNIYAEYFALGDAYFKLAEYEKAAEFFEKAAGSREHRVGALYKAARSYAFAEKWEKAFEIYTKLQKADPENRILIENRAYLSYKCGDMKEADKLYSSLVDKYPDDKAILQNYIKILAEMKDFEAAESCIQMYKDRFGEDDEILAIATAVKTAKEPLPPPEEPAAIETDAEVPVE